MGQPITILLGSLFSLCTWADSTSKTEYPKNEAFISTVEIQVAKGTIATKLEVGNSRMDTCWINHEAPSRDQVIPSGAKFQVNKFMVYGESKDDIMKRGHASFTFSSSDIPAMTGFVCRTDGIQDYQDAKETLTTANAALIPAW